MLINHKIFSDQFRQRLNKCTVYNANGSGGIKKGQKFVKALSIEGVLYQNINRPRE